MQLAEEVTLARCSSCKGLREVHPRHVTRSLLCGDCRRGNVVERRQYHNYWLERYTREQIVEMARAIWG